MSIDTTASTSRSGPDRGPIGLVLAGGGARGAYEVGALSVLLPALEDSGEEVTVIAGTSVGALNAAWLAANIHRPARELVTEFAERWEAFRWNDVIAPVWSSRSLGPVVRYIGATLFSAGRLDAIFDSSPLRATIEGLIDIDRLNANVDSGRVHSAAVVATSSATSRSVVFHSGGPRPDPDDVRGIDYTACRLTRDHVLASAAIPGAFRPVEIAEQDGRRWYMDGGTRLNTPIKPALKLGAERMIVIGLNSTRTRNTDPFQHRAPDVVRGLGELTQAVLADPLAHDVRTLAAINELAEQPHHTDYTVVPYILIEPEYRDRIGEIASRVFAEHYAKRLWVRSSVSTLGSLLRADAGPAHGELLSYLFFAPEFTRALIRAGADDAERWIREPHDHGLWQHGRLGQGRAAVTFSVNPAAVTP